MLAYYIGCFINVLQLILGCVPHLTQHALLSASTFYTHSPNISNRRPGSKGEHVFVVIIVVSNCPNVYFCLP